MTRQLLTLNRFGQGLEDLHAGEAEGDFAGREAAAFNHGLVGVNESLGLRGIEGDAERLREQDNVGLAGLAR